MKNTILVLLISSVLITSACKKTSNNPTGPTTYGTYTLGDSTYTVTGYSYYASNNLVDFTSNNSQGIAITFTSPGTPIPPSAGNYPLDINTGRAYVGITSNSYGFFKSSTSNQSLTVSQAANGYLNYSVPNTWVYLNGVIHTDSLIFSANLSIPAH